VCVFFFLVLPLILYYFIYLSFWFSGLTLTVFPLLAQVSMNQRLEHEDDRNTSYEMQREEEHNTVRGLISSEIPTLEGNTGYAQNGSETQVPETGTEPGPDGGKMRVRERGTEIVDKARLGESDRDDSGKAPGRERSTEGSGEAPGRKRDKDDSGTANVRERYMPGDRKQNNEGVDTGKGECEGEGDDGNKHRVNQFFLASLALRLYSAPTSEAFIERLFSVLKYILGKRRLSLDIKILLPLLRLRGLRIKDDVLLYK
jgi:hypothetical protein